MRFRSTLGIKFVALVSVILIVTLGTSASWFFSQQQRLLEEQLHERSRILGHFASMVSTEAILAYDFLALQSYVEDVSTQPDIVFSVIRDAEGHALTSLIEQDDPQLTAITSGRGVSQVDSLEKLAQGSREILLKKFPITQGSEVLGELVIGLSRQRMKQRLEANFVRQLTTYSIIIVTLSIAIYLVFLFNVLNPVRELIQGSRRIASGVYDTPVKVTTRDEMGLLTESFNAMMEDVRQDQELLNYQANYDALTGLPNRMLALEELHREIALTRRLGGRFAVVFIDLNNFKLVNDTMGHKAGDQLLVALSERFRTVLRETDILARLGGDEFLLLLPTADEPDSIREAALRLVDSLNTPISIGEHEVFINCSMGVAIYPDDGETAEALMANADNAMYQAKRSHSEDLRFFAPEMNRILKERMELEHDLQLAILRDQFELHFQPINDVRHQRPAGAEALLRWHHPEMGMIPPDTFIPLAETTGKIIPIGKWVIRTAVAHCRQMLDEGMEPGYISVNVSRIQLTDDFPDFVLSTLQEAGVDTRYLRLEVTESALMDNSEKQSKLLHKLNDFGIHLLLDDFGTGFSSLNYLKHYPFHVLKIDKSFIDGVPEDEGDAALVRGIIAMSHSLGLDVVAEGVEHESQRRFLVDSQVGYIQGYLFARPQPFEAYRRFLLEYSNQK